VRAAKLQVKKEKMDDQIFAVALGVGMFLLAVGLVAVAVVCVGIVRQRQEVHRHEPSVHVPMVETNRLFTESEDVDFVGIGIAHRKQTHFALLEQELREQNITVQFFEGINGKEVDMDDHDLAPRYVKFFEDNRRKREAGETETDYRGHLGCTLSHLAVIGSIERMTVIFEDDAVIVPDFRRKLQQAIADTTRIDPAWEVLVLGFSANYKDSAQHKLNDHAVLHKCGIVRLKAWIGAWAVLVRNEAAAQRILEFFSPISWHIDIVLAERSAKDELSVYGCVPPLVKHPGLLRMSSWDHDQVGDPKRYNTTTNL
jgi:GR25 family glycosyltransferase involved in LPS biosynthesis